MPDIVVMFFLLGVIAGVAKSDLKVPKAAYDTLSILLMLTLGLKGGLALHGNVHWQLLPEVITVILLGVAIPLALYPLLRKLVQLSAANSASIAAHYGSASAGTFAVAIAFAEANNLSIAP
ncbi:MAG TPA: sodium-dependent bicarbonate transport family permease, partial [Cellvibrio sp.]|nr:sodium-dependent bicarbonate transport family permease [Cellvibrio sp.]